MLREREPEVTRIVDDGSPRLLANASSTLHPNGTVASDPLLGGGSPPGQFFHCAQIPGALGTSICIMLPPCVRKNNLHKRSNHAMLTG